MKLIALDLGQKSCGVAISDPTQTLARGFANWTFEQLIYEDLVKKILEITKIEKIERIIIGYPITLSGEVQTQAKQAKRLKKALSKVTDLEISLHDERFTSKMAYAQMKSQGLSNKTIKTRLDEMSAVVILQDYLDQKGSL
jgi:putative Holliday junction resolvase